MICGGLSSPFTTVYVPRIPVSPPADDTLQRRENTQSIQYSIQQAGWAVEWCLLTTHLPLNPSVRSSCSQYALQFSVQYAVSFGAMALQFFIQSEKQSAAASDANGNVTRGAAPII